MRSMTTSKTTRQTAPQPTSHRAAIRTAFRRLRSHGAFARMNFECCSSCAWYQVGHEPSNSNRTVVFYNQQSDNAFYSNHRRGRARTDTLQRPLYLQWHGDAQQIIDALRAEGLDVEWEGTTTKAIMVRPTPLRVPTGGDSA